MIFGGGNKKWRIKMKNNKNNKYGITKEFIWKLIKLYVDKNWSLGDFVELCNSIAVICEEFCLCDKAWELEQAVYDLNLKKAKELLFGNICQKVNGESEK